VANLTNPNPYVFWLAIGVPTLQQASEVGTGAVVAFISALYTCLVGSMTLLAYLAGWGTALSRCEARRGQTSAWTAYRITLRALSLMLLAFAVSFLLDGIESLRSAP
jgi:threonine/homoserine/homoserine lactone efflux protein